MQCPQPHVKWHSEHQASEYPCGRCLACRQTRAQDWAMRIKYELTDKTKTGDFVTLTYSDENQDSPQLNKKHLANFFKLMRHHHRLKYYGCGEYGERHQRRHFHALIIREATKELNYNKYWKKGEIHVGAVTDASIAYCTGYVLKANPVPAWVQKGHEPYHVWSRGLGDDYMTGKTLLEMAREGTVPRRWKAICDPAEIPPEEYKAPGQLTKGWEKYGRRKHQRWFQERTRG
ncbi:MAG: replication initiator protein [Arizlama microvirus]|nr:MAG: replication initiator protein [Arizlama microvirus]